MINGAKAKILCNVVQYKPLLLFYGPSPGIFKQIGLNTFQEHGADMLAPSPNFQKLHNDNLKDQRKVAVKQ